MASDLYVLLGVRPEADDEALKKAYRARARELHPDKTGGDKDKAEKFKEMATAYAILSDAGLRRQYDSERSRRVASGSSPSADTILGMKFDDIVNRVGREGVTPANIRSIFDELMHAATEFKVKTDEKIKKAADDGPESLIETIGEIFGIDVNAPPEPEPEPRSRKRAR